MMKLTGLNNKTNRGISLIEVSITILLVAVAVLGAMEFHSRSVRDARLADMHSSGSRLAWLLLEGWRSSTTITNYDPIDRYGEELAISASAEGPPVAGDFTVLGRYVITVPPAGTRDDMRGRQFYATVAYKTEVATQRNILTAAVGWSGRSGSVQAQTVSLSTYR